MKVFTEHYPDICKPFAVCIGKFDGVHIGHRRILDALLEEARTYSAASLVYSFEPRKDTQRLATDEEKTKLFESLGMDMLVIAELTDEFMAQPAELFIEKLAARGQLKAVAVGRDFRFGRGAAGDVELLKRLGESHGFTVHAIEQVEIGGRPVSSTAIRELLKSGDVKTAAALLGREYPLTGEVVRGRQIGGMLGFRTANLLPPEGKLLPRNGVYAAYVDTDAGTWPAMTNIGVKPTVDGNELTIESHLLEFEGDLYGKKVTVRLVKRIRDETRFDNIKLLEQQLIIDNDIVKTLLIR
jgi:riboflavin kinase/FMN adenylyltransferase